MPEREELIGAMAGVKARVRRRVEDAVDRIIRVVWQYRSAEFSFDGDPELDAEVNAILTAMSDGNMRDAREAALRLLELLDYDAWVAESFEWASRGRDSQGALFRLDMHASHLKDLLAGWMVVAAVLGLTEAALRSEIFKTLSNPFASEAWRKAGLSPLSWGRGYARDVIEGMTVVCQDFINASYQYAKVRSFVGTGAIGYRTERNSNYDCKYCDDMTKKVWPLDEVVLPYHPRCVCIPVPVYENETI